MSYFETKKKKKNARTKKKDFKLNTKHVYLFSFFEYRMFCANVNELLEVILLLLECELFKNTLKLW